MFTRAAAIAEGIPDIHPEATPASDEPQPIAATRPQRKRTAKSLTQEIKLVLPQAVAREIKAAAARRGITASQLVLSSVRQTVPAIAEILRAA